MKAALLERGARYARIAPSVVKTGAALEVMPARRLSVGVALLYVAIVFIVFIGALAVAAFAHVHR